MRSLIIPLVAAMALLAPVALPSAASAAQPSGPAQRKPDLADIVAGAYSGSVIADARGSSQSDVAIAVTRVGKNLVRVSSDYPRIPTVDIPLTAAMDAIVTARGHNTFLVERAKNPRQLDLSSIDGATWLGYKD